VIVAWVGVLTVLVFTVNVPLVIPDAIVMLIGTVAELLPLVSITVAPLVGAGPLSVTAPCELFPPTTVVGFNVAEATVGLLIPDDALNAAINAIHSPVDGWVKTAE
jgi:hypothetical protein